MPNSPLLLCRAPPVQAHWCAPLQQQRSGGGRLEDQRRRQPTSEASGGCWALLPASWSAEPCTSCSLREFSQPCLPAGLPACPPAPVVCCIAARTLC